MPLLLAAKFPLLLALAQELWGLAVALFGTALTLYFFVHKERKEQRQEQAKKQAEAQAAEAAWKKKMEECVGQFVDKDALDKRFSTHGHEIGENQSKIKAYHDAAEGGINALAARMTIMEGNFGRFNNLPSDFIRLQGDVQLQSKDIKNLGDRMDRNQEDTNRQLSEMSKRQDQQFAEIIGILKTGVYTK